MNYLTRWEKALGALLLYVVLLGAIGITMVVIRVAVLVFMGN